MNNGQHWYVLDGHTPVRATWYEAARFFESGDRIVEQDERTPGVKVSTIFLSLDHNFDSGRPILFETMIFGGFHDGWQERCSTWDEALVMHKRAVWMVRKAAG